MKGRILVIRGGAIGDFVLTLPVLTALRRQFPEAHLEVLGYPHIAALALAGGLVDAVRPLESRALAGFFARRGVLDPGWSAYFAGFHLVVSFLYDPDDFFRENVGSVSGAQYLAGCHRPAERGAGHATDQLLRVLERLAVFEADPQPRLALEGMAASDRVALHPGSGSERKNWPERHWRELVERVVLGWDLRVLLVGGEAEGERLERLSAGLPGGRVEVLRSRPLPEVARRLAGCRGFVGHDSGISHLAAAVGLPGVVLWGPTTREVWQPRSPRVRVLEAGPDLAGLDPARVLEALENAGWLGG